MMNTRTLKLSIGSGVWILAAAGILISCVDIDTQENEATTVSALETPGADSRDDSLSQSPYRDIALERAAEAGRDGRSHEAQMWAEAADNPAVLAAVFETPPPTDEPMRPAEVADHDEATTCRADAPDMEPAWANDEVYVERPEPVDPGPRRHVADRGENSLQDRVARADPTQRWHQEPPRVDPELVALQEDFIAAGCAASDDAMHDDACREHPYAQANYHEEWGLDDGRAEEPSR